MTSIGHVRRLPAAGPEPELGSKMKGTLVRRLSAAIVIAAAAGATFVTSASAQPVETGSFAFTSDPGDWVGQGGSYSYSVANGDDLTVTSSNDNNTLNVSVHGASGDQWSLTLVARLGQALAPGEYNFVDWSTYSGSNGPGLELSGNYRGCGLQSGSFTIDNITFGPFGYVQNLDATFVQRCYQSEAAIRGEVHIANPAPPPVLELGATIGPDGTASQLNGSATVHGTISCTKPVTVDASILVTQVVKRVVIRGYGYVHQSCTPDQPAAWTARVDPVGATPYRKGDAEVNVNAWATDPLYNVQIDTQQVGSVLLDKSST
jgi:hypothetical protein